MISCWQLDGNRSFFVSFHAKSSSFISKPCGSSSDYKSPTLQKDATITLRASSTRNNRRIGIPSKRIDRINNNPKKKMSGRPSDTDQINGQPNTKPGQSAGRFFLKRFTYLRHISSILRHVRDVISGRGSPLVASVTVGWSRTPDLPDSRRRGSGGRPAELMKFSQRFPQVVTCGQSLLGTYCTRRAIVRYCPGENVLISASQDAAGRYVRTRLPGPSY